LISQSLAVIVIGGLTTSTVLTLVVVPVAYALLEGWRERILGGRHAEEGPADPPSTPGTPGELQPEPTAEA
jgi:hydrophobic/amphiphilic exporter-1 (mainly G- bacteria), HAE1 family